MSNLTKIFELLNILPFMMNRKGGIFTILEPYLKKFFMHCLSINLQTTTIKAYEYKLKLFNEYISQESVNSVENITADNIRCFY